MLIREATAGDVDLVSRMRVAFMAGHRGVDPESLPDGFAAATTEFVARRSTAGTLRTWLAEDGDGRCLGIVSLLLHDMPPRPEDLHNGEGYVINMYVDPAARSRGIGRALLDACVTAAHHLGLRKLTLHATDEGRPLYESSGFTLAPNFYEMRLARPADAP